MHALREFHKRCLNANTKLLLSGVHGQTEQDLRKFGLIKQIGEERVFPNIDAALAGSRLLVGIN